MGDLGERLRQAREAQGLTLEQAEEATKIRRRFLEALEQDDYDQIPGEAYVRGFVRNYAQFLGLDPEEALLASGRKPAAPILPKNELGPYLDEPLEATPRRWMSIAAIVVLVLAVVAGGGWALYTYVVPLLSERPLALNETPEPTPTVPLVVQLETPTSSPTPTATPTSEPAETEEPTQAPVSSGLVLRLEATHRSWVSLTIDGEAAWAGTMEVGDSREWEASREISIHSGNAGGLRVWLNGQEQPAIGKLGAAADYTWTVDGAGVPTVQQSVTPAAVSQPDTPTYTPSPTMTITPEPGSTEPPTEEPAAEPTVEGTPGAVGTPPTGRD